VVIFSIWPCRRFIVSYAAGFVVVVVNVVGSGDFDSLDSVMRHLHSLWVLLAICYCGRYGGSGHFLLVVVVAVTPKGRRMVVRTI
jgi:hypothetical protein